MGRATAFLSDQQNVLNDGGSTAISSTETVGNTQLQAVSWATDKGHRAGKKANTRHPIVLITAHILMGHFSPMLRIASELVQRGWNVAFLGPTAHKKRIESSGAMFFPLHGAADIYDKEYYLHPPTSDYAGKHWSERVCADIQYQLIEPLPTAWECFKAALKGLHEPTDGGSCGSEREVILLTEAFSWGVLPMFYGADLPSGVKKPLGSICISVTVPAIRSVDLPPLGYPFPYDPSPVGRVLNQKLWAKSWTRRSEALTRMLDEKLTEAGATSGCSREGRPLLSGANYLVHDVILQLGVPGIDYPRSDWPSHFRFVGLVQGWPSSYMKRLDEVNFPWWKEILENSKLPIDSPLRRKVIVVSQGTVEINPLDLIIPTLQAYATSGKDVLVVAILGWKDASLNEYLEHFPGQKLPDNALIADFLNYDTILQHADVWIQNAGFGALCHGIVNGVPMVCAGEGMDKVDNSRRVAWAGVGVDLGVQTPSAGMVKKAVDRVLSGEEGPRFRAKIAVLREQSEQLRCFDAIEKELLKVAERHAGV